MPAVRTVLIVGGGIAGMTLATALRQAAIAVDPVELNPRWNVPGIGIALQGATLRALRTHRAMQDGVERRAHDAHASGIAWPEQRRQLDRADLPPVGMADMERRIGEAFAYARIAIEDTIVLADLLAQELPLGDALARFMARRYERCRMVVKASAQLAAWDRTPGTSDADPVGVLARTNARLAEPI